MESSNEYLSRFQWKEWPEAERLVYSFLTEFLLNNVFAKIFSQHLLDETSTNLIDWVDHIVVGGGAKAAEELLNTGYKREEVPAEPSSYILWHPYAHLPRMVVDHHETGEVKVLGVIVKCGELDFFKDVFTKRFGSQAKLGFTEGSVYGPYCRTAVLDKFPTFYIAQRRGFRGMTPARFDREQEDILGKIANLWCVKRFRYPSPDLDLKGTPLYLAEKRRIREIIRDVKDVVKSLGPSMAAEIVMANERFYWQKRNTAARFQKERQDKLGLGWANHDHHTFRSSRRHFRLLIKFFETLGFKCRERFHAGSEAGWGAQILDHPETDIVIFADVDLAPEEVFNDFAHEPLKSRKKLGTIGLWCALHGESILQAGMHHLEIQCNFDLIRRDFTEAGQKIMKPFSDLPMLRQAFTEGERWPVADSTLQRLLKGKKITEEQSVSFKRDRVIGSHLEHLWRGGGYKGFNQKGINEIISAVDPRKQGKETQQ